MINIVKEKGNWIVKSIKEDKEETLHVMDLIKSNITNNFHNVANLVNEMNEMFEDEFKVWFDDFFKRYVKSGRNSELFLDEGCEKILDFSKRYLEKREIDFSKFVDHSKKSKTSILFEADDIQAIALTSTSLKLYAIFWCDIELSLTNNAHRIVYAKFLEPCVEKETTTKIYQIIRSRTCRSSVTDRYMWEIIKLNMIESPETYTMQVFNFLMNTLFSTLEPSSNPIPFIVSVIDDSIGWILCSAINKKIVYGESFGDSSEVYGSVINKNMLHIKCCNDTVAKAAAAAMNILENDYALSPEQFSDLRDRLNSINIIHPHMKRVIMPIASKVLDVPFSYLAKAPAKHIMLTGVLMYECAKNILDEKYPILTEFLICSPKDHNMVSTKSSYRVKTCEYIINSNDTYTFGMDMRKMKYEIMSSICGVLTACKKNLVYLIDGKSMPKFNYADLETDVVYFYSDLYANKLNPTFEKMSLVVDDYL